MCLRLGRFVTITSPGGYDVDAMRSVNSLWIRCQTAFNTERVIGFTIF
jgi:hypothetical protein